MGENVFAKQNNQPNRHIYTSSKPILPPFVPVHRGEKTYKVIRSNLLVNLKKYMNSNFMGKIKKQRLLKNINEERNREIYHVYR